jgi:hypothetical protein
MGDGEHRLADFRLLNDQDESGQENAGNQEHHQPVGAKYDASGVYAAGYQGRHAFAQGTNREIGAGLQDDDQGNGHDRRFLKVTLERAKTESLNEQPEHTHYEHGQREGDPGAQTHRNPEIVADKAPDHINGAMGEVHDPHDAEDEGKAESDQYIDR